MKGAGCDKQDMVSPYRPVLCCYSSTLYYWQEVSLDSFTGHIRPMALLPARYLVNLIEKYYTRLLNPCNRLFKDIVHIYKLLDLFLRKYINSILDLDLPFSIFSRKDAAEHLLEIHLKVFHAHIGYDSYRHYLLLYIKLDLPVIELP